MAVVRGSAQEAAQEAAQKKTGDMQPPAPLLLPGFVDLQVNGYMGCDFSDPSLTVEKFLDTSSKILQNGACSSYLPTIITSPCTTYEHNLPVIARAINALESSGSYGVLGIHLEGPFISNQPGAVGCHPPEHTLLPSIDLLEKWQELACGRIVLLTIAAELKGSEELCRWATSHNIAVSLGHQLASGNDVQRLVEAGATLCTHLGNGMPNMIHRHANPLWTALAEDRLSIMLITDGEHLPKDAVVAMVRAKGIEGVVVTSDAAPVAGLPNGNYLWGKTPVRVCGCNVRHGTLPCLAGSGALMLQCMNVLASIRTSRRGWLLTLEELVQVGCYTPLMMLPGVTVEAKEWVREQRMLTFDVEKRMFSHARCKA